MATIYDRIKAVLDGDTGTFSALSNLDAAIEINAVDKPQNRTSMTGSEVYENTDATEFATLSDALKSQWLSFCGIPTLDPFGPSAQFVISIFGASPAVTTDALIAARVTLVSTGSLNGLPRVREGDIARARAL